MESSPAVVGCVVYAGTFAGALYALDATDGEMLWRFPVDGLLRGSSSVVGGTVFFGADDDRFYAVAADAGGWGVPRNVSSQTPRWTASWGM